MANSLKPLTINLKQISLRKIGTLTFEIIGAILTLYGAYGLFIKGLRFLGQFTDQPLLLFSAIIVIEIFIWMGCGWVILKGLNLSKDPLQLTITPAFSLKERGFASAIFLVNIFVFSFLYQTVLRYDIDNHPVVPEGQFGVAVAEFGVGDSYRSLVAGQDLRAGIARSLQAKVDNSPLLQVNVKVVYFPIIRNANEARRLGGRNNISMVIWGRISETNHNEFFPNFTFIDLPSQKITLGNLPPIFKNVEMSSEDNIQLRENFTGLASSLIDYTIGLVYFNQKDYYLASQNILEAEKQLDQEWAELSHYQQDVKTYNNSLSIFHLTLGGIYAAQNLIEQARDEYNLGLTNNPNNSSIYIGLGDLDYSLRNCTKAKDNYEKAARISPKNFLVWYSLGNAHFCLGSYEIALKDYWMAIELSGPENPSIALFHLVVGISECRLHRYDEGKKDLEEALRLASQDSNLQQAVVYEVERCGTEVIPDTSSKDAPIPSPVASFIPGTTSTPSTLSLPTTAILKIEILTPTPTQIKLTQTPHPIYSPIWVTPTKHPHPAIGPTPTETLFPTLPTPTPTSAATQFPTLITPTPTEPVIPPIATKTPTGTLFPTLPTPTNTPEAPTGTPELPTFTPVPDYPPTGWIEPTDEPTVFPIATDTPVWNTPEPTPTSAPIEPWPVNP